MMMFLYKAWGHFFDVHSSKLQIVKVLQTSLTHIAMFPVFRKLKAVRILMPTYHLWQPLRNLWEVTLLSILDTSMLLLGLKRWLSS